MFSNLDPPVKIIWFSPIISIDKNIEKAFGFNEIFLNKQFSKMQTS